MTDFSERSGLFKFFYVFFRVITFPIFMVLFLLRHPLWLLLLLLLLAGGAIYWPMSQGVQTSEILDWYQKKYVSAKKDVVKVAKEKGMTNFVPQAIVEEVEQADDPYDAEEGMRGDNYNVKITRDEKSIETKHRLKNRGGFKKSAEPEVVKLEKNVEDMTEEEVLQESGAQGGGLASLMHNAGASQKTEEENSEQTENVVEGTVSDVATVDNSVEENVVSQKENPAENSADLKTNEENNFTDDAVATEVQAENKPEEEINLVPENAEPTPSPATEEEIGLELF